jgi:hypothetical protein
MNEYKLQLTTELIYQLLKGKKLEQIFNNEIRFTILPPQEGVFITIEELNKIVSDRTNMTERLLKLMEDTPYKNSDDLLKDKKC